MLLFVDCPEIMGASHLKTNEIDKTATLGEKNLTRSVEDVAASRRP
jgi:hypothetical protein